MADGSQQGVEARANDADSFFDVDVFVFEARGRGPSEAVKEISKHELVSR